MDRHLTEGSIRRGIIGFAIPIFIGYLFLTSVENPAFSVGFGDT